MNILGIHLTVKFRALGITFGTVEFSGELNLDFVNRKLNLQTTSVPVPLNATGIFNQRGVVLEAWLG